MTAEWIVNGCMIVLQQGDITRVAADAMVNAANSRLAGGGGVDGAIHRAGGPSIMRELDVIRAERGGCPTGDAVVTAAGRLPAKWVIHTVGPVYRGGTGGEPEELARCYRTSLRLAREREARSVSFPSISTGVYGYPMAEAARVALAAVAEELAERRGGIERVVFVLFGQAALEVHRLALEELRDR